MRKLVEKDWKFIKINRFSFAFSAFEVVTAFEAFSWINFLS